MTSDVQFDETAIERLVPGDMFTVNLNHTRNFHFVVSIVKINRMLLLLTLDHQTSNVVTTRARPDKIVYTIKRMKQ